jgi:hypothetical protein
VSLWQPFFITLLRKLWGLLLLLFPWGEELIDYKFYEGQCDIYLDWRIPKYVVQLRTHVRLYCPTVDVKALLSQTHIQPFFQESTTRTRFRRSTSVVVLRPIGRIREWGVEQWLSPSPVLPRVIAHTNCTPAITSPSPCPSTELVGSCSDCNRHHHHNHTFPNKFQLHIW